MDRERMDGLVGRKVAVRLRSIDAGGTEILATLDEVRDDGVVLSEVGELGPGPTMFCPWESVHRLRDSPPGLRRPPHEEPENSEERDHSEAREFSREPVPELPPEQRRNASARTLEGVIPVSQRRTVGGVTVSIASLELHGGGTGVLRWRASLGERALEDGPDFSLGVAEPVLEVRDGTGRELPWMPGRGGGHDEESEGGVTVWGLPETGELRVEVVRLAADAYKYDGDYLGEGASVEGPWSFVFSL